jgi:multidrug efflux pump subunit AcrA (membrane-fusion protein)
MKTQLLLIIIFASIAFYLYQNQGYAAKGIIGLEEKSYFAPAVQDQLRVKKLFVQLGSQVNRDMPLLELSSPALESALQLAQKNLQIQEAYLSLITIKAQISMIYQKQEIAKNHQQSQLLKQSQKLELESDQAKLEHLSRSLESLQKSIQSGLMAQDKLSEIGAELSMLKSRIPILKDQGNTLKQRPIVIDDQLLKAQENKEIEYAQLLLKKEQEIIKALEDQKALLTIKSPCDLMISRMSLIENQILSKDQVLFHFYPQQTTIRLWLSATLNADQLDQLNAGDNIEFYTSLGQSQSAQIISISKTLSPVPYPLSKDVSQPEFAYPMMIEPKQTKGFIMGQVLKTTIYPSKNNLNTVEAPR